MQTITFDQFLASNGTAIQKYNTLCRFLKMCAGEGYDLPLFMLLVTRTDTTKVRLPLPGSPLPKRIEFVMKAMYDLRGGDGDDIIALFDVLRDTFVGKAPLRVVAALPYYTNK